MKKLGMLITIGLLFVGRQYAYNVATKLANKVLM